MPRTHGKRCPYHSNLARPVIEDLVGDLVPSHHIIISEEIGVHKPAKTIYRRAASRVRTPPENCLLVGDNLTVDALRTWHNLDVLIDEWKRLR